ncbi:MAG: LPS export ABC transporter periplasmic protein LptC [Gemmatimonadales bacterium]|jgi:LPS export ABC transporter protein LptC|nr:MAG: LPS export ABC transporter periplasmic protein LptC [Gemmatimonadales bacterium]
MKSASVLRAVLVLAGVAIAAACSDTGARPGVLLTAADTADQTLIQVRHIITRDGVQKSLVEADTAYYYEGSQTFELLVVTVTFYDKDGAPTSTLTSNEGTYQTMTGVMEGRGKVVVRSADGTRTLKSEQLHYDPGKNEISSEVFYTYDQGSNHLEGDGFTSDPAFQRMQTANARGRADEGIVLPGQ